MEQTPPQEPAKPKQPNINDYVAGAMLANGVVWVWMQTLPIFIKSTDQLIVAAIAEFSWVIFIFGGYISSRQVCKRADEKHLLVGLKLAVVSWVMGIFIMFTLAPMPDARLMVALLICFAAGGVLGGYMTVRARLRKRRQASS
ncbi:MAG TPA: hypothetical protein VMW22_05130 [Candidatus Desulfaltia sp.]|nr:hypothetical protein [Candidatus Desulfaltia sp.]